MNGSLLRAVFGPSSGLVTAALGVELERSTRVNGHQFLHFPSVVTAAREWTANHL